MIQSMSFELFYYDLYKTNNFKVNKFGLSQAI
jgi:hypothetical protein